MSRHRADPVLALCGVVVGFSLVALLALHFLTGRLVVPRSHPQCVCSDR